MSCNKKTIKIDGCKLTSCGMKGQSFLVVGYCCDDSTRTVSIYGSSGQTEVISYSSVEGINSYEELKAWVKDRLCNCVASGGTTETEQTGITPLNTKVDIEFLDYCRISDNKVVPIEVCLLKDGSTIYIDCETGEEYDKTTFTTLYQSSKIETVCCAYSTQYELTPETGLAGMVDYDWLMIHGEGINALVEGLGGVPDGINQIGFTFPDKKLVKEKGVFTYGGKSHDITTNAHWCKGDKDIFKDILKDVKFQVESGCIILEIFYYKCS